MFAPTLIGLRNAPAVSRTNTHTNQGDEPCLQSHRSLLQVSRFPPVCSFDVLLSEQVVVVMKMMKSFR